MYTSSAATGDLEDPGGTGHLDGPAKPQQQQQAGEVEAPSRHPRRRCKCSCACVVCAAGATVGAVTALTVVVGVLVATVFKPRDPSIKLESIVLQNWHVDVGWPVPVPLAANVSLEVTVAVKNPNHASFRYGPGRTAVLYRGAEVGEAPFPGALLRADRTQMHTSVATIRLDARALLADPTVMLLLDLLMRGGQVPLQCATDVSGRVDVMNVYRRRARASVRCAVVVFVLNRTVSDLDCDYAIRLD